MDLKDVHILFCDQDPSTGSETLALLKKCSYKVTAVKSAHQVVETLKLQDSDVDIVLTDVELPQEKGFKMLKHILHQDNLSHIAVVVMSDHDEMAVVAKCLHLGAVDYLVKPLRLNEVMNLWTHMWRKRRMLGLPDKLTVLGSMNSSSLLKVDTTADLLSGYKSMECPTSAIDTRPTIDSRDGTIPQLELSLRLALNYIAENPQEQAVDVAPMTSSPVNKRLAHPSAFTTYLKSNSQQPDEQSATNVCSPRSPSSRRSRHSNENFVCENRESVGRLPVDTSVDSPKDASVGDENRPGDLESLNCDEPHQLPMQCSTTDERIFHAGQTPAAYAQGFQPCYAYVEPSPVAAFTGNVQEMHATAGYGNPSSQFHMQQLPQYQHEASMTSIPSVSNVYSYYPLTHLAVPVISFPTWPAMMTSPPLVGGKLIQAERREAALSKFRMKRKGRCFEKKIRYASRKKLAEQRPRVRGQFVKRTVVSESAAIGGGFDEEEGEADDEQGCSELDNNSSPECIQENCRDG
eukprot:c25163_g1_i2 orf=120-1676(+)